LLSNDPSILCQQLKSLPSQQLRAHSDVSFIRKISAIMQFNKYTMELSNPLI